MDTSILIVLVILTATVVLMVFEVVRIDVVAIVSMLALGWTGILKPQEMFSGFSSNAIISIMAVMIMGRGIARTGLMDRFSRKVVQWGGTGTRKVTAILSGMAGLISGFIQNIGVAALFLPVVTEVSQRTRIHASMLLLPVGYAIILGGTLSMVGSGHLILVNDLLINAGLQPFGLFEVTPVGIILLITGIVFFYFFGKYVLPDKTAADKAPTFQEQLIESLQLPSNIWYYSIQGDSPLVNQTTEESGIWKKYHINIIGISGDRDVIYAPWRENRFRKGQELALLGSEQNIRDFAAAFNLIAELPPERFARLRDPLESGFAEVIVPPRSVAVGQTIRQFAMRRRFAVEPLRLFSKGEEMRGDFSDHVITPGDAFIIYGLWEKIHEMHESIDFVVATPYQKEHKNPGKVWAAALSFTLAIGLTVAGFPIAMSFFTGALGMVLLRVLSIQQAYEAIEWKVVFLLAGLLPLGLAMKNSGTSEFLAGEIMEILQGKHPLILLLTIGILSTLFSWIMSNFGAIAVLAPMVVPMAEMGGLDPRTLVLMAAVCVSNSFILPTQQVNALIMTPGNYRNTDLIRGGFILSVLFLAVTITWFYFLVT